ncbi:GTPase-activating protein pac-1 isoform X5 [Drosophila guanche]|nr:GTPase-activating protein pac-1 isoform X5 [Drosophila guanche]
MINNNAKYSKDLDYFETLQETGVTNKVFERKLVSHMSMGFDPFKPLSINTSALEAASASTSAAAAAAAASTVKKQSVLYESLQQHPLAKYQHQQQQSTNTVDGQTSSRMELHKATLANATIDAATPLVVNKFSAMSEQQQAGAALADISESSSAAAATAVGSSSAGVIRRYKPLSSSSFDEGKPMRRISYLRATNNETEFNPDAAATGDAATASAGAGTGTGTGAVANVAPVSTPIPVAIPLVEPQKTKSLVEEHPDPTYDVIGGNTGGGHEFIETPNGLEDVRLSAHGSSRRASMSSDMRSSIHIDAELNGKYVPNELEAFETDIEIKSSCINGKRMSEYRSWRQVKLEIKGDLLRIYSGRHAKSEHNVIELDIRNFKFFDESLDKKKYLIRMQSKPSPSGAHLASLGNELNLDDVHDKLTSSGSSSANEPMAASCSSSSGTATSTGGGPYTEILFKTKNSNEMKRLFGLLQWKDSLNYDDNDQPQQGKQLAEPQKTVATASHYLDDVTGGAGVDNSPLSSHSGGGGMAEGHHHVAALPAAAAIVAATSDSISPVMKARKSSSHKHLPDKDLGSPKSKNWKDLLFRRGGGSGGVSHHHTDLASPSSCAVKTCGSIGVPLRSCPMSKLNPYVPHLVEVCTNIVETKGLSVVGIYRIPGNKAAISELSELVNTKDFQFESCAIDVRWEDVNVVSSLLKLFIRSLPDALMPASYYINFIEADKKLGLERIVLLREIVESLPRHPYETMKHLIRHLCRVSDNCEVNRMEPKNLAIIFGPSIIRTPNDTLETAVKDMKHQCRIVELLVTQYEYYFEGGNLPDLADVSGGTAMASAAQPQHQTQEDQTSMLLHNLSKIERITERETRTSRFIPQLRRRTHGKRSAVNSDTYSGESVLSLDYTKVSASSTSSSSTLHSSSKTTTNTVSSSSTTSQSQSQSHSHSTKFSSGGASSSSSSTTAATIKAAAASKASSAASLIGTKKRSTMGGGVGFLGGVSRSQTRKASLDEKDSGTSVDSASSLALSLGLGLGLGLGHGKDQQQHQQQQQRSSVDISILLTDDDSSSRLSDTGSMSLTTITDTLDSKLRNLRSGSESNDENGSPEFPKNRRHTLGQPLHLHSENIPYADESPERLFHQFCPLDAPHSLHLSRSCTATNTLGAEEKPTTMKQAMAMAGVAPLPPSLLKAAHKLQHSATVPIHQIQIHPGSATAPASGAATPTSASTGGGSTPVAGTPTNSAGGVVTQRISGGGAQGNPSGGKNMHLRFSTSQAYERHHGAGAGGGGGAASEDDDSEGSTTSDPKEKLLLAGERPSPSFFLERYNKKRRDHRLFRSASFNCRNYSTRHMSSSSSTAAGAATATVATVAACCQSPSSALATGLTKDEKTDMNLTKKRQIQNKQNRSIKRRHTVGGPHDYSANGGCSTHGHGHGQALGQGGGHGGHDLAAINYNHHNRHHQQQLLKGSVVVVGVGGNVAAAAETTTTTTTTTTVLRRLGSGTALGSVSSAGAGTGTGGVTSDLNVQLPGGTVSSSSSSNSGSGGSSNSSTNNNNSPQSDGSNGNAGVAGVGAGAGAGGASNAPPSSGSSSNSSTPTNVVAGSAAGGGDQVLEVGIRIKNINRGRY